MDSERPVDSPENENVEWVFLQALCAPSLPPGLREEFSSRLPSGVFRDLAHQIVFEEIRALSKSEHPRSASDVREHLPTRVTARGFPDLDFSALLSQEERSTNDAQTRLGEAYQRLLETNRNSTF